jgi:hypothetical protein
MIPFEPHSFGTSWNKNSGHETQPPTILLLLRAEGCLRFDY